MRKSLGPFATLCIVSCLILAGGCAEEETDVAVTPPPSPAATPEPWADAATGAAVYFGEFSPVNPSLAADRVSGWAMMVREGDDLRIEVEVEGLPPDMMHLIHLHGLTEGGEATCADAGADANGDGVVDLLETEAASGTTLIPFHDDPVGLKIQSDAYPTADGEGAFSYRQRLSWDELITAVEQQHGIAGLDFAQLVVYIHGVPEDAQLPETAGSLPDVPPRVTLPIACADADQVQ